MEYVIENIEAIYIQRLTLKNSSIQRTLYLRGGMSIKLLLIRHGETGWSVRKKYCSFSDIELNEKGLRQAQRLHKKLSMEKVHSVYSSDMKRTVGFAKIVFEGMDVEVFTGLREMNFGIFEGLTYEIIMKQYAHIYQKWMNNPLSFTIPEGEGLKAAAKRVRKALREILSKNPDKTVAVFTHGGPIKILLCDILGLSLKKIWEVGHSLAGISIIEFYGDNPLIHCINDTSHLHEGPSIV